MQAGRRDLNPESESKPREWNANRRAGRDLGGWNAFSEGGARPPRARCGLGGGEGPSRSFRPSMKDPSRGFHSSAKGRPA